MILRIVNSSSFMQPRWPILLLLTTEYAPLAHDGARRFYRSFQILIFLCDIEIQVARTGDDSAALAMMENIDWNVGRLTFLELELEENTIVIFFSDNGPNSFRWNGGMKGKIGSIDEGGLRSPCLIRWPKQIPPGSLIHQISGAIDLLPTVIDLVGLEAPPSGKAIDGLSMAPWLRGERLDTDYRTLFSIKNDQVSVRRGEYRLDDSKRLFNVVQDPRQDHDLSKIYPKLTEELHTYDEHREVVNNVLLGIRNVLSLLVITTRRCCRQGMELHMDQSRSSKSANNSFLKIGRIDQVS